MPLNLVHVYATLTYIIQPNQKIQRISTDFFFCFWNKNVYATLFIYFMNQMNSKTQATALTPIDQNSQVHATLLLCIIGPK